MRSKARVACVLVYIMSMWGSLISAGASSAGEIVILNNEVSLAHAALQQHEYTEDSATRLPQAGNINPSSRRRHRRIGWARSATCAPGGGGVD